MIIEAEDLHKSFKANKAVGGVSIAIDEGETVGLLGPNGAGKSTTLNLLLGLVSPDSGSVRVFGESIRRLSADTKRAIGFVPQDFAFFPELSGLANVTYWGRLYGLRKRALDTAVRDALEFTGLWERRKDAAKTYSGGMQRRLNISCGIVHNPKILIMDEPTVGVDPQSRNHILDSVRTLSAGGATVVYTSHYMEEIQALCDRVVIMDGGKVVADGALEKVIRDNTNERVVMLETPSPGAARDTVDQLVRNEIVATPQADVEDSTVVLRVAADLDFNDFASRVLALGLTLESISEKRPSLETVFLNLTGKTLRD
ncbi:ABC transporter ATP-binding protein [Phytomonospora sp. NPDC050363]|uniref:ABC transporter ATP-binding protein n=1 Tax=Phytomonospora sp. NPDC050363 TaxID=3155642 RepID=UPI0033D72E29